MCVLLSRVPWLWPAFALPRGGDTSRNPTNLASQQNAPCRLQKRLANLINLTEAFPSSCVRVRFFQNGLCENDPFGFKAIRSGCGFSRTVQAKTTLSGVKGTCSGPFFRTLYAKTTRSGSKPSVRVRLFTNGLSENEYTWTRWGAFSKTRTLPWRNAPFQNKFVRFRFCKTV